MFYGERSSVGRAPGCDPGCRGFESRRSPQVLKKVWFIAKDSSESLQDRITE